MAEAADLQQKVPFYARRSKKRRRPKFTDSPFYGPPPYREPPRPQYLAYGDTITLDDNDYVVVHVQEDGVFIRQKDNGDAQEKFINFEDRLFDKIERIRAFPFHEGDLVIAGSSRAKHCKQCPQNDKFIFGTYSSAYWDMKKFNYINLKCVYCDLTVAKHLHDVSFVAEHLDDLKCHACDSEQDYCKYCLIKACFKISRTKSISFLAANQIFENYFNIKLRHEGLDPKLMSEHSIRANREYRSYSVARIPPLNGFKVGKFLRLAFLAQRMGYRKVDNTLERDYARFYPNADADDFEDGIEDYSYGFLSFSGGQIKTLHYNRKEIAWKLPPPMHRIDKYEYSRFSRMLHDEKHENNRETQWNDIESFKRDLPSIVVKDCKLQTKATAQRSWDEKPFMVDIKMTNEGVTISSPPRKEATIIKGQMIAFREPIERSPSASASDSGWASDISSYEVYGYGMVSRVSRLTKEFTVACAKDFKLKPNTEIIYTNQNVKSSIVSIELQNEFDGASKCYREFLLGLNENYVPMEGDYETHDGRVMACYERGDNVIAISGPPKAGKSECISKLLKLELDEQNRILVVSLTNTGVCRVAELLLEKTDPKFPNFAIATNRFDYLFEPGDQKIKDEKVKYYCVANRKDYIIQMLVFYTELLRFLHNPCEAESFDEELAEKLKTLKNIQEQWAPYGRAGKTRLERIVMEDLLDMLIGLLYYFIHSDLTPAEMHHQAEEASCVIRIPNEDLQSDRVTSDKIIATLLKDSNCILTIMGSLHWRQDFDPETLILYQADRFSDGRLAYIVSNKIKRIIVSGNQPKPWDDCSIISRTLR